MPIVHNQECILGIKLNGTSFKIDLLDIKDDQTAYDYICNVNPSSHVNGNGSFSISIANHDFIKGMPLGLWTLLEGCIIYDWGESISYFYLLDKDGMKTNRIKATCARGSASGFKIEGLTRAIFTKARDIIEEFPSATIYNAFANFSDVKLRPSYKEVRRFAEEISDLEIIEKFESKTLEPYVNYIQRYEDLMKILTKCKDERCKRLIDRATKECSNTIKFLK